LDSGDPITVLAGVHPGCFELFGTDRVRAVRDLKGKIVAVTGLGLAQYAYVATIASHIGLDPARTSTSSSIRPPKASASSPRGRSTPISDFLPTLRSCA